MNLKSRIRNLEKQKAKQNKPAWVIVKDGDPIPEGVKAYSPEANPDLWDEDTKSEVNYKSEVKNEKDN